MQKARGTSRRMAAMASKALYKFCHTQPSYAVLPAPANFGHETSGKPGACNY
jgi:hypothetical protein